MSIYERDVDVVYYYADFYETEENEVGEVFNLEDLIHSLLFKHRFCESAFCKTVYFVTLLYTIQHGGLIKKTFILNIGGACLPFSPFKRLFQKIQCSEKKKYVGWKSWCTLKPYLFIKVFGIWSWPNTVLTRP